jgi:hypothetical protein
VTVAKSAIPPAEKVKGERPRRGAGPICGVVIELLDMGGEDGKCGRLPLDPQMARQPSLAGWFRKDNRAMRSVVFCLIAGGAILGLAS